MVEDLLDLVIRLVVVVVVAAVFVGGLLSLGYESRRYNTSIDDFRATPDAKGGPALLEWEIWTPYGGDALADIPNKRVDTMMQRLETDPAVGARWDRAVRPKNLSALVLITFIVASIVWTTIRFSQLGSGAWLLPHIVVTFVLGQLLGVFYQTRFSRMKRELMQLQSDVLLAGERGAGQHEKLS